MHVDTAAFANYIFFFSWKSRELSNEIIKSLTTSNNMLSPRLIYVGTETRIEFNESCLKQNKITYTHGTIVNIYIV